MSPKLTLVMAWTACGAALMIIQSMIWKQVNNRLPPEQQIRKQARNDLLTWFRKDGLLAQHARLYPESLLTIAFKVLWGTFWVLVAIWYAVH